MEEVLDGMAAAIIKSNANIIVGKLPVIKKNANDMKHLFQNLISNSIKFTGKDATPIISINAQKENNAGVHEWKFIVKDNGIGIDESINWNAMNRVNHISRGTSLTSERIKAYNKVYHKNIKTRVINLLDNEGKSAGTRVEIEIN